MAVGQEDVITWKRVPHYCPFVTGIHRWKNAKNLWCRHLMFSLMLAWTNFWENRRSLQWRHNGHDSVSNHQPHDCLLNRLFRRRSKKNQSSASLAFVRGIHRRPVNSPHKWPVTRKMFPFDDVIIDGCWFETPRRPCGITVKPLSHLS